MTIHDITRLIVLLISRTMSQVPRLHEHLANAVSINNPAACSGVVDCKIPVFVTNTGVLAWRTVFMFGQYGNEVRGVCEGLLCWKGI